LIYDDYLLFDQFTYNEDICRGSVGQDYPILKPKRLGNNNMEMPSLKLMLSKDE